METTLNSSKVVLAMDLDRVEALSADLERIAEDRDAPGLMRDLVGLFKARVPHYHWVGIYLVREGELQLGPYAGATPQHEKIRLDAGICGAAARSGQSIVVADVRTDPRYLACSVETRSEIVVPLSDGRHVLGVMDIDSNLPDAFNEHDQALLERAASLIAGKLRTTQPLPYERPEAVAGAR